jgi:hypothetical protein
MSLITMRLSLQTFPQTWQNGTLSFNLIALPVGDPIADPLFGGATLPFSGAPIPLVVRLITGGGVPTPEVTGAEFRFLATPPAGAATVFTALAAKFPITPSAPPSGPTSPQPRIFKLLPDSYLAVAPQGARSLYALGPDEYACEIAGQRPQPATNPPPPGTSWGAVYGYALRRTSLATALGLRYVVDWVGADAGALPEGGWLYVTLDAEAAGNPWVTAWQADPTLLRSYAAWLPPAPSGRLFAPALFAVVPLAEVGKPDVIDEARLEVALYTDGYAKIVHTAQAATIDPSTATDTLMPPGSDIGVQIGWDDEQVLAWHNRQLDMVDRAFSDTTAGEVALGVLGYRIDARDIAAGAPWVSLTAADVDQSALAGILGNGGAAPDAEPIYEAVATARAGATRLLPTYFAQWRGRAISARDDTLRQITGTADPASPGTISEAAPQLLLLYGHSYECRVRLADLSCGGPAPGEEPDNPSRILVPIQPFRRHVPPKSVRLTLDPPPPALPNLPPGSPVVPLPSFDRKPPKLASIKVQRPLIGYPEALFTPYYGAAAAQYQAARDQLIALGAPARAQGQSAGLPDPDSEVLEIRIEVRAPKNEVPGPSTLDGEFRVAATVPIPLPALDPADLGSDPVLTLTLDYAAVPSIFDYDPQLSVSADGASAHLILPTARDVRLRLRANGTKLDYFAVGDTFSKGLWRDTFTRSEEADDSGFLADLPGTPPVMAFLFNRPAGSESIAPSPVAQLADALGLVADGLTLTARPGERVIFAGSHNLRHLLRADAGALTFASASELLTQWIVAITQEIARDWTWDGLAPPPVPDADARAADAALSLNRGSAWIGTGRVPRVLGLEALTPPDPADSEAIDYRKRTRIVFFDGVDPNGTVHEPAVAGETDPAPLVRHWDLSGALLLPDGTTQTVTRSFDITLPIAVPPKALPALASAGLALSPYAAATDYASTEPRERALWIELADPVPDDQALFFRLLAEAPDPLLHRDLAIASMTPPDPPPIDLDPELVRRILPLPTGEDGAGLDAMIRLDDFTTDRRFVRLPRPANVAADDPRLFGLWGYEFRFGHTQWATAQARFGRPLQVAGVQHPAPPLRLFARRTPHTSPATPHLGLGQLPVTGNLVRLAARRLSMAGEGLPAGAGIGIGAIETHLTPNMVRLSAAYARTVWRGRFLVQPEAPPTTTIVFLVYARVRRADAAAWRNILLLHRVAETEWLGAPFGVAAISDDILRTSLLHLGLPITAPLGAVAVEFLPGGGETLIPRRLDQPAAQAPFDPIGPETFAMRRILRVSPLVPIAQFC